MACTHSKAATGIYSVRDTANDPKETRDLEKVGAGIAIGVALGVALGAAIGNIGAGIAIGIAIGAAIGASKKKNSG